MTENQKLREAFEAYITDNGKWPNAILKAPGGQYLLLRTSVAWQDWKACAEALAPPTADHIPEILFARDIYDGLGYAKWENFNTLIKRCKQLIAHGQHEGSIQDTERFVEIGYGARRRVIDYKLDAKAHQLVISMASAFKLVGHYPSRNETSILSFIERWCKAKNISFIAQSKEISGHVFDALVGGSVAIEFDEPHHLESRQSLRDANKDRQSNESGIHVLRIGLESNVIDVIVDIESILSGKMVNGLTQAETDASASVSGLTAAPVGEREAFEQFAQNCPMGKYNVTRRGEGYDSSHTQIMWDAWQARAALSAGDAVDAASSVRNGGQHA